MCFSFFFLQTSSFGIFVWISILFCKLVRVRKKGFGRISVPSICPETWSRRNIVLKEVFPFNLLSSRQDIRFWVFITDELAKSLMSHSLYSLNVHRQQMWHQEKKIENPFFLSQNCVKLFFGAQETILVWVERKMEIWVTRSQNHFCQKICLNKKITETAWEFSKKSGRERYERINKEFEIVNGGSFFTWQLNSWPRTKKQ